MARDSGHRPHLIPRRTDRRAVPLLYAHQDRPAAEPIFFVELHGLYLAQNAQDSVVFIPPHYARDDEEPDPSSMVRCWKTTEVYELLARDQDTSAEPTSTPPRVLKYLGQDPWTALPLMQKPAGMQLGALIKKYRAAMYSSSSSGTPSSGNGSSHDERSRIASRHLPLAYQWTLHLISAVSYLHKNSIILGDLSDESCFLETTSPYALCLAGFPDAGYGRVVGDATTDRPFHPLNVPRPGKVTPSLRTDVFLVGCLVYQIMTGWWPGEEGAARSVHTNHAWYDVVAKWIPDGQWPELEREFLGDIVHGCWKADGYESIEAVREDLEKRLQEEGWAVQGDDLSGLEVDDGLFSGGN